MYRRICDFKWSFFCFSFSLWKKKKVFSYLFDEKLDSTKVDSSLVRLSKRLSIAVDETAKPKMNACKSRHILNCNHHYVQCVDSWLFANDFTRSGSCVFFLLHLKLFTTFFSVILWILFCSKKKKKLSYEHRANQFKKNIEFGSGECQHFENYFSLLEWQSYVIADANGFFWYQHCVVWWNVLAIISHSHSKWLFSCMWLYKYILITRVFYYFFSFNFFGLLLHLCTPLPSSPPPQLSLPPLLPYVRHLCAMCICVMRVDKLTEHTRKFILIAVWCKSNAIQLLLWIYVMMATMHMRSRDTYAKVMHMRWRFKAFERAYRYIVAEENV